MSQNFLSHQKKSPIFLIIDRVYCFSMEYWEVKSCFWSVAKHLNHLMFTQLIVHRTPQSSKTTILNTRCSSSSFTTAGNFPSLTVIVTFYITFCKNLFFFFFYSQDNKWEIYLFSFGCSFGKLAINNSKKIRSLWIIYGIFFCNNLPAFMHHLTF